MLKVQYAIKYHVFLFYSYFQYFTYTEFFRIANNSLFSSTYTVFYYLESVAMSAFVESY